MPAPSRSGPATRDEAAAHAAAAVTALYQANALGMVRLAHVMVGDRGTAEDIVQEAFCGLYRRWPHLADHDKALSYVRSSVLNACRSALRSKRPQMTSEVPADAQDRAAWAQTSGEAAAISEEQRRTVMAALRKLPDRQREVLVLRFYLDLTEAQIAAQMGIGQSTVRSAAHRAFAALSQLLEESP